MSYSFLYELPICFFTVGSLLLGILAWILPIIGIGVQFATKKKQAVLFNIISLVCCVLAIFLQMILTASLVYRENWGTLRDLYKAEVFVSGVLILGTILANILSGGLYLASDK